MRQVSLRRPARRIVLMLTAALLALGIMAPALAAGATRDRIEGPFETVIATAYADNEIGVELMFAECDFVQRVELPDGSAIETQHCSLTGPFVVFPGTIPTKAFNDSGDACVWMSDYWLQTDGSMVFASSFRQTVTPSGQVSATTMYPAEPIDPAGCGI